MVSEGYNSTYITFKQSAGFLGSIIRTGPWTIVFAKKGLSTRYTICHMRDYHSGQGPFLAYEDDCSCQIFAQSLIVMAKFEIRRFYVCLFYRNNRYSRQQSYETNRIVWIGRKNFFIIVALYGDNLAKGLAQRLQRLQNRAARIITRSNYSSRPLYQVQKF